MPLFSRHWTHPTTGRPDPEQLRVTGPALAVQIAVPHLLVLFLTAARQPIPTPHVGIALIDTGASLTCVDETVLRGLGLSPTGTVRVATPSAAGAEQPVFPCVLSFPGSSLPEQSLNQVVGAQLAGLGFAALIGRDILKDCLLVYNGPEGFWTLAH